MSLEGASRALGRDSIREIIVAWITGLFMIPLPSASKTRTHRYGKIGESVGLKRVKIEC